MLRLLGYALPRAAWAGGLALAKELPAGAQTPAPAQAPSALQRWHVRYELAQDGRATMTQELHHQVLQAGALEELKTYSVGFSNGIQQGQV
ncbi:MAG: transglutaminase protein, partial [Pseudomonadota bacterium]|nr:transglutaminase protein [Pseudomonadota bacterium]